MPMSGYYDLVNDLEDRLEELYALLDEGDDEDTLFSYDDGVSPYGDFDEQDPEEEEEEGGTSIIDTGPPVMPGTAQPRPAGDGTSDLDIPTFAAPPSAPRRAAAPRRQTTNDALDAFAVATLGVTYAAAGTAERAALRRAYAAIDRAAISEYGKSYRDLTAAQRATLHARIGDDIPAPEVLPEDDPLQRRANSAANSAARRAEAAQRRIEAEERRLARESERRDREMLRAGIKQPSKAPRVTGPKTPTPTWEDFYAALEPSDVASLTNAWSNGQSGFNTIDHVRLYRVLGTFPQFETPTQFLIAARLAWMKSRPTRTTRQAAPRVSEPSFPSIRFRRPSTPTSPSPSLPQSPQSGVLSTPGLPAFAP